jgi:sec-independent protein translocase protein TatA
MRLGPTEITLIVVVVVLLFGGKKLPELARGLGKSLNIFKSELKNPDTKSDSDDK